RSSDLIYVAPSTMAAPRRTAPAPLINSLPQTKRAPCPSAEPAPRTKPFLPAFLAASAAAFLAFFAAWLLNFGDFSFFPFFLFLPSRSRSGTSLLEKMSLIVPAALAAALPPASAIRRSAAHTFGLQFRAK